MALTRYSCNVGATSILAYDSVLHTAPVVEIQHEQLHYVHSKAYTESASMLQWYRCLWAIILHYTLGLHLSDYSTFDHCNHWIFDAAIDLAKNSWGGGIS